MIKIHDKIIKKQKNFWSNCLFHPTDATEDAWGRRILDRMARDGAIKTVRIYAMLEDIVYIDENGSLAYDFRINDLRLDYLLEKDYDVLLAYGMMPEAIASNKNAKSCVSKNKTRYKGKLINTSKPADYALWEEVCYQYTKHIVERYGEETVAKWHLQCFNEPDIGMFFLSDLPEEALDVRIEEYCRLYSAFVRGIERVSGRLCFGGPALAHRFEFLEGFLAYIKENKLRLDFISFHNYASTGAWNINSGEKKICLENWIEKQEEYMDVINSCGFSGTEIVVDEWGMAGAGFFNVDECPAYLAREHEVFSAYYVKLIAEILKKGWNISKLMICLSGQHEMITDFSGFRNFFTLNFFAKPIYNAHILASKLYESLLKYENEDGDIFLIPTKSEDGQYSVLISYCAKFFEEDLPDKNEEVVFAENIEGRKVIIYCIDKNTTNPYRLYEKMGKPEMGDEEIKRLREEGKLKPVREFKANKSCKISLKLTANATYLIEVI